MSFNARAIGTLGIGFGALAIATIGFIAEPAVAEEIQQYHGGGGRSIAKRHEPLTRELVTAHYDYIEFLKAQRAADALAAEKTRAAEEHDKQVAAAASLSLAGKQKATAAAEDAGKGEKGVVPPTLDEATLLALFDEFF